MKHKNKTTTKTTTIRSQAFPVGTRENLIFASIPYTENDFKNSLLIVSVLINIFLLIAWISVQVDSGFANTIAQSLVR